MGSDFFSFTRNQRACRALVPRAREKTSGLKMEKKRSEPAANGDAAETEADLRRDPLVGRLRTMFDEVAAEPLPTELMRLLQQLDEAERKR